MTLRRKTLLIIGVTLVGLIVILDASSQIILLGGFAELEEQSTRRDVERTLDALINDLAELNSKAGDWAAWDDTYAFIEDANDEYVKSNLVDETFIGLRLNLMLFINSSGRIVFGKAFDLKNQKERPVPESLQEHVSANGLLLRHPDTGSSLTGMVLLPEGPMLLASRPILTSENKGPIRGTLIMGRYLDAAEIQRLTELTHLSLTVHRFDDAEMPPDLQAVQSSLSEEAPILVRPLNADSIAGYTLLRDIYGQPALLLRVDIPRTIYMQGQASLGYFILSLLAIGLVFGAVALLLLEKTVLSRLARLSADVRRVGASGDLSARVTMAGRDELSSLAGAINGMLETVEHSQQLLAKTFASLRDAVFIIDAGTTEILDCNPGASEIFGYSRQEMLGRTTAFLHVDQAALAKFRERLYPAVQEQGFLFLPEFGMKRKDGRVFPTEHSVTPLEDEQGKRVGWVSVVRDITERKRAEKVQAATYQISQAANACANLEELYRSIHSILGELMPADNFYIALYDPVRDELSFSYFVDQYDETPAPKKPGRGLTEYVLRTGRPLLASPEVFDELVRQGEVESVGTPSVDWLGVPLKVENRTIGVMVVQSYTEGIRFGHEETDIMSFVSDQVATAIERKQAEAALWESEEKYRNLVERANDGIVIVQDTVIKYVNPVLAEVAGYTIEELIGTPFVDYVHPDDLGKVVDRYKRRIAGEDVAPVYEVAIRRKDGSRVYIEANAGITMYQGKPAELVIVRDLTERKRAEEALRESERKLRLIAENTTDAIFAYDMDRRLIYVNPAVKELTGYTVAELQEANFINWLYPEDEARRMSLWEGIFEGTGFSGEEVRIVTKDGQVKWCLSAWGPLYDESGRQIGIQGRERDITERKRAEQDILRRNVELTALNQIGQALSKLAEPSKILELIYTVVGQVLDNRNLYIALYDEANQYISFPVYTIDGERITGRDRPWGNALTEYVIRTKAPLLIPRNVVAAATELGIQHSGHPAQCYLAVPMLVGEEVIGVISIQDYEREEVYDASHMELLSTVASQAAIALENARLYQQTRNRAAELAFLNRASQAITSSLDIRKVLDQIVDLAGRVVNAAYTSVVLIEEDGFLGISAENFREGSPLEVRARPQGITRQIIASRQPLVFDEVLNDGTHNPAVVASGVQSYAGLPLMVKEKVLGVLFVHSYAPGAFRDRLPLLTTLANQVAIAIENARLFEDSRRQTARAEALARVAARLNAQLDFDTVLNAVCEETARALNVPATSIDLYDEKREAFCNVANFGLPSEFRDRVKPTPRAVYDEYTQKVGRLGVIPDLQTHPGLPNADLYAALNIRTVASASMLREGQLVGGLNIFTLGEVCHFAEDELALLKGLADQAALAITNARLFEEANRRLKHVQALREIDMSITSSLDLRVTLDVLLGQVTTQLGIHATDVLLLNPYAQTLEYAAGRGFRTAALQHTSLPLGDGHAGRAALERSVISIANLPEANDGLRRSPLLANEGFISYYAAPLIAKGQVKGVLEIFHRAPLNPDQEWLDLLETLAGQAALAIDNAALFNDLQRSNVELTLAYDTTIEGWARALDLRDKETEGHTERVTNMTVRLARAMGMSEAELVHVRRGALLHDIGKMGIPDAILFKPGPLTEEEWEMMRQHPTHAYDMLSPIAYLRPVLHIPYCHHEKWDGTGYPRGLKGGEIPLAARIFAVVDAYDAMTSDRPYRPAMSHEEAIAELRRCAGTQFDPEVVDVFLRVIRGE